MKAHYHVNAWNTYNGIPRRSPFHSHLFVRVREVLDLRRLELHGVQPFVTRWKRWRLSVQMAKKKGLFAGEKSTDYWTQHTGLMMDHKNKTIKTKHDVLRLRNVQSTRRKKILHWRNETTQTCMYIFARTCHWQVTHINVCFFSRLKYLCFMLFLCLL